MYHRTVPGDILFQEFIFPSFLATGAKKNPLGRGIGSMGSIPPQLIEDPLD